jgi:dipeptidyl aminopeptidase/acylaminoacyl peptidase
MRFSSFAAAGLALAITCAASAQNAPKRPMTFADLQAMKRISDPQISPSGKWVLFSVTDVSLEKNTKTNHLWAVPLAGGKEVQLTSGKGESEGRFSPNGKSVMYSSAETGSSQTGVAPWDDAAGTIGAGKAVTSLETETDGAIWAPDSKHFLFVSEVYPECESKAAPGAARNEEEASCNAAKDAAAAKNPVKAKVFTTLLYRHWDHYQGEKRSHIFYASTEGGAPEDLTPASVIGDHVAPTFSLGGPMGYAISPDGKEVAYVVNLDKVPAASTNNDIYTLQVGAEPSTAKKVSTSPGSDDGPAYSPDGKWLAWRSQARNGFESDKFDLVVMGRRTSAIQSLTENFDRWVDEFTWAPDSKTIYFAAGDQGEEPVFAIITGIGEVVQLTSDGDFGDIHVSPDGRTLVASVMTARTPPEVLAVKLGVLQHPGAIADQMPQGVTMNGSIPIRRVGVLRPAYETEMLSKELTTLNKAELDALDLQPMERFFFTGAERQTVEGFIIRPPNFDPTKKYPLKFVMHGGPQTAQGDGWSYRWNAELLAANGYVVIGINRRGSTSYGQKFVDEVSGDWGGKAYIDLMKGLDYAEAKYPFIDKTRECALGASYGGFMANWVLTHTDRFKCIVTHDGMYNPQSAFGTTEELWFNEWEFRPAAADGVGVEQTKPAYPWDYFDKPNDQDPFRKWSPMLHIKDAKTPTLIIHSQLDYRLDVSEGFQLFTALQLLGVPSKMLYFENEGHWVLKPRDSQLWYETVDDWCDRWTHTNKYAATAP